MQSVDVSTKFQTLSSGTAMVASEPGTDSSGNATYQALQLSTTFPPWTQVNPQWPLQRVNNRNFNLSSDATLPYAFESPGTGVNAYVVDTGLRFSHEEFGQFPAGGGTSRAMHGMSGRFWVHVLHGLTAVCTCACGCAWPPVHVHARFHCLDSTTRGKAHSRGSGATVFPSRGPAPHHATPHVAPPGTAFGDDDSSDCNGHGTHNAASLGGLSFGVAKNATLWSVRAVDCDGTTSVVDLLQARAALWRLGGGWV